MAKKKIQDPAVKQAQKQDLNEFKGGSGIWSWMQESSVASFGRSKVLKAKYKKK